MLQLKICGGYKVPKSGKVFKNLFEEAHLIIIKYINILAAFSVLNDIPAFLNNSLLTQFTKISSEIWFVTQNCFSGAG